MKDVLLIRPGETEPTMRGALVGHLDAPLTPAGVEATKRLAHITRKWRVQTVACGSLERCRKAAEMVAAEQGITEGIQVLTNLDDVDYGVWNGKTIEEIRSKDEPLWKSWLHDPFSVAAPGGESLDQVLRRLESVRDAVLASSEHGIAIVTEEVPAQLLICMLLGLDRRAYWRFLLDPASVSLVRIYHGEATLALLNYQPSA